MNKLQERIEELEQKIEDLDNFIYANIPDMDLPDEVKAFYQYDGALNEAHRLIAIFKEMLDETLKEIQFSKEVLKHEKEHEELIDRWHHDKSVLKSLFNHHTADILDEVRKRFKTHLETKKEAKGE